MRVTRRVRHVIGCMTGTSLDGLDAALTRIDGEGLEMNATFVRMASRPFADDLRQTLRSLASSRAHPAEDYVRAARTLGEFHANVAGELINNPPLPPGEGGNSIDFVVAHGQTIFHAGDAHLSWQLFDPWPLVRQWKLPVCYDLRQADLIAGGQGAPITPIADQIMYHGKAELVVNLGGIVNVTSFAGSLEGIDVGPCNLLIDAVVKQCFPRAGIDKDGSISAAGKPDKQVFEPVMNALPFFNNQYRSLGREDLPVDAIRERVDQARARMGPHDIVASAVDSVAELVSNAAAWYGGGRVVLAGGGARNPTLVQRIGTHCRGFGRILLSDDLGIPCEAREAMGFAVLGALSQDKVPITFRGVAGAWVYP